MEQRQRRHVEPALQLADAAGSAEALVVAGFGAGIDFEETLSLDEMPVVAEDTLAFARVPALDGVSGFPDAGVVVAEPLGSCVHVGFQVGFQLGLIVIAALVGPVGVIVTVGLVLADVDSPGVVDSLLLGVPDSLGSPLLDGLPLVGTSVGVGVAQGVVEAVGVVEALGVVDAVAVAVAVGVAHGVTVWDGVGVALVGTGIVGPPELSAGFGASDVLSLGVGVGSAVFVGVGVGLWVCVGVGAALVGLAEIGVVVGFCVAVGVSVGCSVGADAEVGADVGLWDAGP